MLKRAFTLLELLVTVAIVGILAALLFPVFARAREMGRRTACVSQLRQLGLGFAMYRSDSNGYPLQISTLGRNYIADSRILVCPSDRAAGQHAGNAYLEGNTLLTTGVSYEYFPQWSKAQDNGWWEAPPKFGTGKWDDLTPLAGCPWHWAKTWNADLAANLDGVKGWELVLTAGGSVRKFRIEEPLDTFTPAKYL